MKDPFLHFLPLPGEGGSPEKGCQRLVYVLAAAQEANVGEKNFSDGSRNTSLPS